MITELLTGKDKQSQKRLDELMKSIGENPNILWYPSAGNDYRDILELTNERSRMHKIDLAPDLFIHTDYMPDWIELDNPLFLDERTYVEIEKKFELEFTQPDNYEINPEYVDFPNDASKTPKIYLLDVIISSKSLGVIKKPIIYFFFENINFLDQVILKHNIRISHLVKVRDGCGCGGNRKSISVAYAFLSAMKTKYLLVDNEEHTDFILIDQLKSKYNLELSGYDLRTCDKIYDWSGFNVKVFSISFNKKVVDDEINNIIGKIRE